MMKWLIKAFITMENKNILVRNSILKAQEALDDADHSINVKRYTMAQNRIYYAIFYAVTALGYLNNFTTSKHSELSGWFNKKFVYEESIFDDSMNSIYKIAYENRKKSDYDFTYKIDPEKLSENLDKARIFVDNIVDYIKTQVEIE